MSQDQHPSATPANQGTFTILYFASASSYTQKATEQLPAPIHLSDLFSALEARYPGIGEKVLRSCGVSLDGEYVDVDLAGMSGTNRVVGVGAEVAIIPPVSSG